MPKSHGIKRDSNHVPRPPNSFILFRSEFKESGRIPSSAESREQVISRVAGSIWRSLPPETRAKYDERAKQILELHRTTYPDYVYRPQRRSNKQTRKKQRTEEEEVKHCEMLTAKFVPDMVGPMPQRPARKGKTKLSRAARTAQEPTHTATGGTTMARTSSFPDRSVFTDPLCQSTAREPSSSSIDPTIIGTGLHSSQSIFDPYMQTSLQPSSLLQPPSVSCLTGSSTQPHQLEEPLEVSKYIKQRFDRTSSVSSSSGIAAQPCAESSAQSFSASTQDDPGQDISPDPLLLAQLEDLDTPLTLKGNVCNAFQPLELGFPAFDSPSHTHARDSLDFRLDQADFDAFCTQFGMEGAFTEPLANADDGCDGGGMLDYVLDMDAYFRER